MYNAENVSFSYKRVKYLGLSNSHYSVIIPPYKKHREWVVLRKNPVNYRINLGGGDIIKRQIINMVLLLAYVNG